MPSLTVPRLKESPCGGTVVHCEHFVSVGEYGDGPAFAPATHAYPSFAELPSSPLTKTIARGSGLGLRTLNDLRIFVSCGVSTPTERMLDHAQRRI